MLARRLRERGHEVTVIAGRRGYDDPNVMFGRRESLEGIRIIRVPSLGLGKDSRWRRSLNFASFLVTCAARLVVTPRQQVVVALTSPPLISWLGSVFTRVKGGKLIFWPMDLNPDEAIAAGWLKSDSLAAWFFSRLLMSSMGRAESIVALDRFMKDRITAKGIGESKIEVLSPSTDDGVRYDEAGREEFRREHGLQDKFVVMYAGNHSPCNPLDTLLAGVEQLQSRADIVFMFVGGGSGLVQVKEFARRRGLKNIRCLPYQPLDRLSALLSAADLHVVVMGDAFKGILHPSKIYNILAVGTRFLFIGPKECHVTDLIAAMNAERRAVCVPHGAGTEVARIISEAVARPGLQFSPVTAGVNEFSGDAIYSRFIDLIESAGRESEELAPIEAGAAIEG
jgi:hypothetical protein